MNHSFYQKIFLLALFLLSLRISATGNTNVFETFFEAHSLQVGYYLVGNADSEYFILDELNKTKHWAGKLSLIEKDELNLGSFRFNIYDSTSQKMLYTKGFCSLFEEWQTTDLAKKENKAFYYVNTFPFPKKTVKYELQKRNRKGIFVTLHDFFISPNNYFIKQEKPIHYKFSKIHYSGEPANKIDIAFLAEGYSEKEMLKFENDVKKIWNYFTKISPFKQYKNRFNIYAIASPSQESGTDIPGKYIYKNTMFNFSFYTFNIERYLTTFDIKALNKAAEIVPHDYLFVVINSEKYGGAGFYNYYSSTTSDHKLSLKVAIHEFGHAFAGLADEYYSSETAYNEYFDLKTEPWEPNITTLVNFENKWKNKIKKGIPIPTPRTKEFENEVGVFEGGGYSAKGIFSPAQDCRMKSNIPEGFCPVCSDAIVKVINYLSE